MAENIPTVVVSQLPTRNLFNQALSWIVFFAAGNCNNIRNEGGLGEFENSVDLTVSNILDMESGFSNSTTAQGLINSGMRRVKYTLCIMHWAQDESRCSCTLS